MAINFVLNAISSFFFFFFLFSRSAATPVSRGGARPLRGRTPAFSFSWFFRPGFVRAVMVSSSAARTSDPGANHTANTRKIRARDASGATDRHRSASTTAVARPWRSSGGMNAVAATRHAAAAAADGRHSPGLSNTP